MLIYTSTSKFVHKQKNTSTPITFFHPQVTIAMNKLICYQPMNISSNSVIFVNEHGTNSPQENPQMTTTFSTTHVKSHKRSSPQESCIDSSHTFSCNDDSLQEMMNDHQDQHSDTTKISSRYTQLRKQLRSIDNFKDNYFVLEVKQKPKQKKRPNKKTQPTNEEETTRKRKNYPVHASSSDEEEKGKKVAKLSTRPTCETVTPQNINDSCNLDNIENQLKFLQILRTTLDNLKNNQQLSQFNLVDLSLPCTERVECYSLSLLEFPNTSSEQVNRDSNYSNQMVADDQTKNTGDQLFFTGSFSDVTAELLSFDDYFYGL